MSHASGTTRGGLQGVALALLALSSGAEGQETVRLRVQENFRAERNGTIVARLRPGARLQVEQRSGQWLEATLEGWVWARSLQIWDEGVHDLRVTAAQGENIRAEPAGEILGHLLEGALLEEQEREPGWIRVRRTGWIWVPSTEAEEPEPPEDVPARWMRTGAEGAPLLTGPDGDTLASARPGTALQVLAREGNWSRIRLEGWVWRPLPEDEEPADTAVLTGVTPGDMVSDPERFTGRVVSMPLQFISLERAEKVRTDFFEGEPFLLTRAVEGERSFVYVAVPPDRLDRVRGITPLDRVTVVGRVRTVAASLTGNPILELLDLFTGSGGG